VLSARIIPGNERNISRLIGHLYKRGANIIEEKRRLVHVSGHASQEDIKIITETARPKYLIPIHGEYWMLFRHKEYVKNHVAGYTDENVLLIENGDVLEFDENGARVAAHNQLDNAFIDEESLAEINTTLSANAKNSLTAARSRSSSKSTKKPENFPANRTLRFKASPMSI
jgi:ribonuclease J